MSALYLIGLIAAIWVIYNVWQDNSKSNEAKLVWTVCAIFFSVITAIVYLLLEKKGKIQE